MTYGPTKVLSEDEVEAIHLASLKVLQDHGIDFLEPDARKLFPADGVKITDARVRFDPEFVMETIKTAPSEFTLHARNPEHSLRIGGNWMAFGSVASPPNFVELDGTRHAGTRQNFQDLLKLTQMFNIIHFVAGYPVEPVDLHSSIRHLETTYDMLTMTDKALHCYSLGRQRNQDVLEMTRIARQVSNEQIDNEPSVFTIINSSSPLRLDIPMLQGIMEYSKRGQLVIITPFTLAGAMAPVTIAGALTLAHAEALAGLVLAQIVRPGAPIIYGSFTSNVDMKSGSPAFGTPEYVKAAFGAGQLARHIGLPWRSSNATASNCADAQSAYESEMSLWGALMGGCNYILHAAGWLEGGLTTSYEKFILDIEMLQMFAEVFQPVGGGTEDIALDAIAEVGAGGHFFGCAHTMARYRTAFYSPLVSDWQNFGNWQAAGAKTATERASEIWRQVVDAYQPPPRDPAVVDALNDFVARRTAEGGAPPVS